MHYFVLEVLLCDFFLSTKPNTVENQKNVDIPPSLNPFNSKTFSTITAEVSDVQINKKVSTF